MRGANWPSQSSYRRKQYCFLDHTRLCSRIFLSPSVPFSMHEASLVAIYKCINFVRIPFRMMTSPLHSFKYIILFEAVFLHVFNRFNMMKFTSITTTTFFSIFKISSPKLYTGKPLVYHLPLSTWIWTPPTSYEPTFHTWHINFSLFEFLYFFRQTMKSEQLLQYPLCHCHLKIFKL